MTSLTLTWIIVTSAVFGGTISGVHTTEYCSASKRCSGLSKESCLDAYSCTTYETSNCNQGDYGMFDTTTCYTSTRCTTSRARSCFEDFDTEYSCNSQPGCLWRVEQEDDTESEIVTNEPTCSSVSISSGCDDTYMGSIAGDYR